jgi:hypothetical protein
VPVPDVFSDDEVVVDESDSPFPSEAQGKSLYEVYKELKEERVKIGHAFLDEEDPIWGYADIIGDRLESEEQASARRAKARYISRRMLQSEFFASSEQSEDAKTA